MLLYNRNTEAYLQIYALLSVIQEVEGFPLQPCGLRPRPSPHSLTLGGTARSVLNSNDFLYCLIAITMPIYQK
jgi:hypothetical protein